MLTVSFLPSPLRFAAVLFVPYDPGSSIIVSGLLGTLCPVLVST